MSLVLNCGGDDSGIGPTPDSGPDAPRSDSGGKNDSGGQQDSGDPDSGPKCEAFQGGAPITEAATEWTWIGVPEAKCRNGSATGFAIRKKTNSKKLFIYLQGGGACFNGVTCLGNPSSFAQNDFNSWAGTQGGQGIFNDDHAENPVKDWNAVFIPYCSGDIFGGSQPATSGDRNFTGVANVMAFLKRVVPTFSDVDQVLLTGSSAGGFGASVSYERVADAFCPRPVVLIDDAGPVMSDTYLAPCLQKHFRDTWNLNAGLPAGCTKCNLGDGGNGGGLVNFFPYVIEKYPRGRFGLLSAKQDSTIRMFMSFGGADDKNDCSNLNGGPGNYGGPRFEQGLAELRDTYLKPSPRAGTYYIDGTEHTFLGKPNYFTITVQGVKLTTWVANMLSDNAPTHVAEP